MPSLRNTIFGLTAFASSLSLAQENRSYKIEPIPLPPGEVMGLGSLALMPDQKVAVATRRGDVWICEGAYDDDVSKVKWSKFAEGLHEPLGMYYKDGWLYLTQRPEFTRIRDTDNDGEADEFETISSDWGINGNYHEYAFGSTPDKDGNTWIALCLTGSSAAESDFRGWGVRITPEGEMIPTVSGVRSPGGIGFNAKGDTFYTDNQGLWNGSSSLKHMKPGGFMGNPTGNKYFKLTDAIGPAPKNIPKKPSTIEKERANIKELVPPAVILPHGKVGQSPTAIITDTSDSKFGPFAGQLLIGEQTHSQVQRVALEKINGVYQGAVFHFLQGFQTGIVPMAIDSENGTLFVGGTNRGWGARGGKPFSFERVRYTGTTTFEYYDVKIQPDGFILNFTEEIDPKTAEDPSSYTIHAWTYLYQKSYGSPEVEKIYPKVTSATVSKDKRSVHIVLDTITKGHVHSIQAGKLKSLKGNEHLLHPTAYYTVNEIPEK